MGQAYIDIETAEPTIIHLTREDNNPFDERRSSNSGLRRSSNSGLMPKAKTTTANAELQRLQPTPNDKDCSKRQPYKDDIHDNGSW